MDQQMESAGIELGVEIIRSLINQLPSLIETFRSKNIDPKTVDWTSLLPAPKEDLQSEVDAEQ